MQDAFSISLELSKWQHIRKQDKQVTHHWKNMCLCLVCPTVHPLLTPLCCVQKLCPQIITTEEYWVSNVLGTVVASLILLVALIDTMHPSNNCWVGSTPSWDRASSGLSGSWHWLGALCSSMHLVDLQVWELGKCWILLTSTRHRFKMQSYCPFTHSWRRMAMWAK